MLVARTMTAQRQRGAEKFSAPLVTTAFLRRLYFPCKFKLRAGKFSVTLLALTSPALRATLKL